MTNNKLTIQQIITAVDQLGEQTATSAGATRNIVAMQKAVEVAKEMGNAALVDEGEKLIAQLQEDEQEGGAERILYRSLHRVLKGQGFIES